MKVLLVNWSWYPTGGDWTYVNNIKSLYEQNNWDVIPFSTQNEKNIESIYSKYFVPSINFKEINNEKNIVNGVKVVKNSIVSRSALSKLDDLLADHKIDIAHLHNIHHHITPAIISKLKKNNIPIIWSLHDYKIICPENSFVSNGQICERCYDNKFYNCTLHRCKKQSFLASSLASLEAYYYHGIGTYKKVDAYLCPSSFLKNKFEQFGFDNSKLHVTNYCYDIDWLTKSVDEIRNNAFQEKETEKYVLYVGRIELIKGIKTLINAVTGTNIILKIAGTGSALNELSSFVEKNEINNVHFLGFQDKASVINLTINSCCVVCPSEWYENFPFSIIESFLMSKPVIGSDIGGIPELVVDGFTGFLFHPGDESKLLSKLQILWNDSSLSKQLGINAYNYVYNLVNFNKHWSVIHPIISSLMKQPY